MRYCNGVTGNPKPKGVDPMSQKLNEMEIRALLRKFQDSSILKETAPVITLARHFRNATADDVFVTIVRDVPYQEAPKVITEEVFVDGKPIGSVVEIDIQTVPGPYNQHWSIDHTQYTVDPIAAIFNVINLHN